jgi:signal peptidase I
MSRRRSTTRTILEPLGIALVLALSVRSVAHIYVIPSPSMVPTLEVGDHILVVRYLAGSRPSRGDVVVFRSPSGGDELLVKRIVAVAGDLIESRSGRVVIGGHTVPESYVADGYASGMISPQIVPNDAYFVMGDNRAHSSDSRSWGVLPRRLIEGRARVVLWSSGSSSTNDSAWAATSRLNPGRREARGMRLFVPIR